MGRTVRVVAATAIALLSGATSLRAQATVADVQIAPPSVTLNAGQRSSVFATAYDARGGVITTARLAWSSSNPAVIRIEVDSTSPEVATLVALAPGAVVVEARVGNRRGVAAVQVSGAAVAPPPAAPVSNAVLIKLEPSSLFLLPGEAGRLSPVFLKDDGTPALPARLAWKSLVPGIANVDSDGGVVGIAPGQGLIEASAGTLAARVPVAVTLSKIAITRRAQTMSPGMSDTLTVFVPEQNNRSIPPTAIQWRSSDETVARVSPFGVVSAIGGGRAEILASGFLQEIRVPVNVHKQVEFLRLSPPARDTIRLPLGGAVRFVAEPQAADGTPVPEAQVTWRLLDTSVVSLEHATGLVNSKKIGTTRLRIGVAGGGLDTAWAISVFAGGLRFASDLVALGPGERTRIAAAFTDDAGRALSSASGLRWTSSTPGVAQVDSDGNVTATGIGRAIVFAATAGGTADSAVILVQGELLVSSTRGGTPDVYALERTAPGTLHRVTSFPSNEVAASFAPGGSGIVLVSSKDGNQEIYAIDADGQHPRRLTSTPAQEDSPEMTPDGRRIIYASNATGTYQIWSMNADGTEQKRLTEGPAFNFQPSVSPDGQTVAFTSTRDGNYDIFLMNLDGTNQRSLLRSPAKETIPQWFPDGQLGFLQEQRIGTGRNAPVTSVVVRRDASGQLANLTAVTLAVTDFAIAPKGDLLALIVSKGEERNASSRLYLAPAAPGAPAAEVPGTPGEQIFSPAFRR